MTPSKHREDLEPRAPDVLERETADGGFSRGWGLHHPPSEHYILDCHTHMHARTEPALRKALGEYFARAGAMRLRRHVALDGNPGNLACFGKISAKDDRFLWMCWPHFAKPDLKTLRKAARMPGFAGLKLHNAAVIEEGGDPETWLNKAWDEVFAFLTEVGRPVLWHVTQRLTDCPYMGGGRNSYWKVGWEKGVKFGNRELLEVFQERLRRCPGLAFIGAHHLHIGPDFLAALLGEHPNLYVDLSCGNIVRFCDDLNQEDRQRWREHLLAHPERILFGTDVSLGDKTGLWHNWETLAAHIRFLHQLRLPKPVLELVAHENFERLARLEPATLDRSEWGNVRP